jgi:hypothetical protein
MLKERGPINESGSLPFLPAIVNAKGLQPLQVVRKNPQSFFATTDAKKRAEHLDFCIHT